MLFSRLLIAHRSTNAPIAGSNAPFVFWAYRNASRSTASVSSCTLIQPPVERLSCVISLSGFCRERRESSFAMTASEACSASEAQAP